MRRALLWALALAFVAAAWAAKFNDYHNHFCGKENCYELLNIAEVCVCVCVCGGGGASSQCGINCMCVCARALS
jgi:hypothetical protein